MKTPAKRIRNKALILMASFVLLASTPSAQTRKLKIYISADMEGVVGAVTGDQLGPTGFEYARFREFMTAEVNAACQAAFAEGATEIVVSDSHGNGENLLIEKLPSNITVVRSWPRPLGMMGGIDETFDGAIFIGYHSSTSNPQGVRAHTLSSARLTDVKLNGNSVSEGAINAALAGHFNVPIIMVSGDDAAVKEVTDVVGPIEGAVVKWAYSFHSARTLMPETAYQLIREKVTRAMKRIKDFKPHKLKTPVQVDVSFKNYRPAEMLAYLPIVKRIDSHSVRFMAKDIVEASSFLQFITSYEPGLEP
jgi:D-amino peptidase